MSLTEQIVITGCGASAATASAMLPAISAACAKYEISGPEQVAAFLANIGVESAGLTQVVENLNYSAQRLAQVWPFRFAENPHVAAPIPNALAKSIAGNPQAIANTVYANRLGNGDTASGDGWNFRGQGFIQLTGRTMIMAFYRAAGKSFISNPGYIQTPAGAAMSAAWFFATQAKALEVAASGQFAQVVKLVNGALPCAANQGPLRISRYNQALALVRAAMQG